ncbi:addiction module protein [Opitutus terrae]|uniref:addiction module protein n=1 Tax=Opitutus terrae TaxID=107709 RepID=UPI0002E4FCD0|nr:addiction module protein [Opitutus terrae]
MAEASLEEKLALIDELWDAVRRSGVPPIPREHLTELERRVTLVAEDPSIALTPAQARALLRK